MHDAAARRAGARPRPAGRVERDLGQARPARRRRVGARADAPLPDRADAAPVAVARAARRDRGRSTASGSTAPATRAGLSGGAISPVRARSSARPTPTSRCASRARTGRRSPPEAAAAELRAEVTAGRLDGDAVEAVLAAAGHRVARRRGAARRAHRPRGRRAPAARARPVEQGDRRAAGDLAEDGAQPHRAHLREDRRLQPGRGQPVRHAARPAPRRVPVTADGERWGNCPMRPTMPPRYLPIRDRSDRRRRQP